MAKRWQKPDLTYLKRYAAAKRVAELAQRFRTDEATVRAKLTELGLVSLDSPRARARRPVAPPASRSGLPASPATAAGAARKSALLRSTPAAPARPGQAAAHPAQEERYVDPLLVAYEEGVRAMYRQRWAEAARCFARVAAGTDTPELSDRARQLLDACRAKTADKGAEPTAEDPFLQAVVEKNRGEYDAALLLCSRGGRQSKDERYAYLAASVHALKGQDEEAIHFLDLAIELNSKNRVHAFHDPDFAGLRGRNDLSGLFGLA